MALRLSLVSPAMNARRLRCLVVRHGTAFTTEIPDCNALVGALQRQLCARIATATSPHSLSLFLARDDTTGDWLRGTGDDVAALALDTLEGEEDVATRVLTERNWMDPASSVRTYFADQPPLYNGADEAIHVLVRVECTPQEPVSRVTTRDVVVSIVPVVPEEPQQPSWIATLVASLRSATVKTQLTGGAAVNRRPQRVAPPVMVRCSNPHGFLWLPDGEEVTRDSDAWPKTSMYVPSVWRELSSKIFRWTITPLTRPARFTGELRGRRALVTGAPRAGKSVFLSYLLLQLLRVRSPPVCIVDVPGVTFARVDPQRGRIDEGDRATDFRDELSDVNVVYLFDVSSSASDRGVTPLSARIVFARSILVRPQLREPRESKRTQSFTLPLWPRADIQSCAQCCFPRLAVPSVVALFYKWGGVPGRLFVRDAPRSLAALETALARLSARAVVDALASVAHTGAWGRGDNATGVDDVWRALVVPTCDGATRRFAGGVSFTSQFVCDRALALAPLGTHELRALVATAHTQPALAAQIRVSLAFLEQEEEEKHADASEEELEEAPWLAPGAVGAWRPVWE